MKKCEFLDSCGTFRLEKPENTSYLYFPVANEAGIMSSVTPFLGGDCKTSQNTFVLSPVSAEELHNNKSSRNFWLLTGQGIWSATGMSAETHALRYTDMEEESSLEAGVLWQKVSRKSKKYPLASEILSFAPLNEDQIEVMKVTVTNTGSEPVTVTPVSAVPMYGRSADNYRDHRHVTSLLHRIETTRYGVVIDPTLTFDERGHQKNKMQYFVCGIAGDGSAPTGFYPVAEDYIGEGGSFEWPISLLRNAKPVPAGEKMAGYEAIGAIRFAEVTLAPGESRSYMIFIGVAAQNTDLQPILEKYNTEAKLDAIFAETAAKWKEKCNVSYHTADKWFDNFMYWVNVQPMLRRIYGCSFLPHHDYGRGGRGWRDLWQDCLALLIMSPDGVRESLMDNFGGVRMDGTNATIIGKGKGEFIADRNNIPRVWMDHGVWPLLTLNLYINQTGDLDILDAKVPYFKDALVFRGEGKDTDWQEAQGVKLLTADGEIYTGTVLEHLLLQNLTSFYDVGHHNQMRLRGADWNDALDMAPQNGESVAFTAAYAGNLAKLSELLLTLKEKKRLETVSMAEEMGILLSQGTDLYESIEKKQGLLKDYCQTCKHTITGKKIQVPVEELAANLKEKAEWLNLNIRSNEWIEGGDEGWFNGYYDNSCRKVEGYFDTGVRMMLTSQVFTLMNGAATDEQAEKMIRAADRYLYEKGVGGYKLNTNFHEVKEDLGRMFGFAYGHKENGAVFSHMCTMYANALYTRGFVKAGWKVISALYEQAADFETSCIYPGVPEYFSDKGRGLYHYLTGSASWLMLTVISEIFGIKGELGQLKVAPKLLLEQFDADKQISLQMNFQGVPVKVTYVNPEEKEYGDYGISAVTVDGVQMAVEQGRQEWTMPADVLGAMEGTSVHEVVVTLG